jgi:hypothetical protein
MSFPKSTIKVISLSALAILSLILIFTNLDGDISILRRHGDYGDEGYWIQNAFNKVKHGVFLTDDQAQGYFGAPLFTFLLTAFSKTFGATLYSARLFSMIIALFSACLLWVTLKKILKNNFTASLLVVLFLSLPETKLYGAWCSPITLEWLFSIAFIYWVLNHPLTNFKNITIAAVLILLNVLSKSTSIYLIGVFAFQIFFDLRIIKQKGKLTTAISSVIVACVLLFVGYNIIQTALKLQYPVEYAQFKQLIKWNMNFKQGIIDMFSQALNPFFWMQNIIGLLKFTSGILIMIVFIWSFKTSLAKINYKLSVIKSSSFWVENRNFAVFGMVFFTYWIFLLLIGQTGFDRRIAAQIPVLFVGLGIAINNIGNSWFTSNRWKLIGIVIAIFVFGNQAIDMFNSGTVFYLPLLGFMTISASVFILFIRFGNPSIAIFYIIAINCVSTFVFQSKTHTLSTISENLSDIKTKYNVKYMVGFHVHQLASNNEIIPIWYQKKLVNWNLKFPLFNKDHATLVVTSMNHPDRIKMNETLFSIKDLPSSVAIIDSMDITSQKMLMFDPITKKTKLQNEQLRFYVVRGK